MHYYLTYFLAMQVCCFDKDEAFWIADADQKAGEDGDKAPATGHVWPGRLLGPATSLFPIPFKEKDNEARGRHRTYHALTEPWNHQGNINNLMSDKKPPFRCRRDKKKENDAVRRQKLSNFGAALHYTQDTFSHRGYSSDNYGHGVEKMRGKQHTPDKTHGTGLTPIVDPSSWIPRLDANNQLQWEEYSRVDRAWWMVGDTWNRMKQWCSFNECFGSKKQLELQQRNWVTARPFIQQFLESNGTNNPRNEQANPNNRSISPAEMDFKRQILRAPKRQR